MTGSMGVLVKLGQSGRCCCGCRRCRPRSNSVIKFLMSLAWCVIFREHRLGQIKPLLLCDGITTSRIRAVCVNTRLKKAWCAREAWCGVQGRHGVRGIHAMMASWSIVCMHAGVLCGGQGATKEHGLEPVCMHLLMHTKRGDNNL